MLTKMSLSTKANNIIFEENASFFILMLNVEQVLDVYPSKRHFLPKYLKENEIVYECLRK